MAKSNENRKALCAPPRDEYVWKLSIVNERGGFSSPGAALTHSASLRRVEVMPSYPCTGSSRRAGDCVVHHENVGKCNRISVLGHTTASTVRL
jgi:hypothetical protein